MSPKQQRGAALLLVIAVIVALVVIATPFALSMRLHERTSRAYDAGTRARLSAEASRNLAIRQLMDSHQSRERRDPDDPNADEVDGFEEFQVEHRDLSGQSTLSTNDPRGDMFHVEVQDDQGKVDLNTASAWCIAGLLGTTMTTQTVSYGESKELFVESTEDFYTDHNPNTVDGILRVGGEYIAYRHTTRTSFVGLTRGLYLSRPMKDDDGAEGNDTKEKIHFDVGTLVCDARAWKIAFHPLWSALGSDRNGELNDFERISSIKKISDWDYGSLRLALQLLAYGVTMDQLKSWGVADRMAEIGVDPSLYERPAEDETDEQKEQRELQERALKDAGIDVDQVTGLGKRAVARVSKQLSRAKGKRKDTMIAKLKERVAFSYQKSLRIKEWLRREVPKTIDSMVAMTSNAPDLEAIGRAEFEELRPYITVSPMSHDGRWTDDMVVQNRLVPNPDSYLSSLQLIDSRFAVPGAIAMITPMGGGRPIYRRVWRSNQRVVSVIPKLDREYEQRTLKVRFRLPSPININTAPKPVLVALFSCVSGRGTKGEKITPQEARNLADRLLKNNAPIRNHVEFASFMLQAATENIVSQADALALVRNGINPADRRLRRATAPICYRSGDVYTLEATGVVNDPQGRELARHAIREVVQVAPPEALEWSVDSQADFEDRLGIGRLTLSLPNRYKNLLTTSPTNLSAGGIPNFSHAPNVGDVRLTTGEVADQGYTQHYRNSMIGSTLPQAAPAGNMGSRQFNPHPTVASAQITVLGPSTVKAWIRVDALQGPKAVLFDVGQEETNNRLYCFYDTQTQELVFQVFDETLDLRESTQLGLPERRAIEARGPVQLRQGNWYHFALSWRGGGFGDLAAFVDGKFITNDEPHIAHLTGSMDANQVTIPVDDTSTFPDQGIIRIGGYYDQNGQLQGGELIEYKTRSGSSLTAMSIQDELTRRGLIVDPNATTAPSGLDSTRYAARGSGNIRNVLAVPVSQGQWKTNVPPQSFVRGLAHDRGAPVYVWGYSRHLGWRQRQIPAGPNNQPPARTINSFQTLAPGNATLTHGLGEHTPMTLLYRPWVPMDPTDRPDVNDLALLAADTVLEAVWLAAYPDAGETIGGFPNKGILYVGGEYIGYDGINVGARQFLNLQRGMFNSTASDHRYFVPVCLVSLEFSNDLSQYPGSGTYCLHQDNNTYEWVQMTKVNEPAFAAMMRFSGISIARHVNRPANATDPTWFFMNQIITDWLGRQGTLPPGYGMANLPGLNGPARQCKEWLKRIEPVPNGRARDFTGIGATLGDGRGPGRTHPARTKLLPTVLLHRGRFEAGPRDVVTIQDDAQPMVREERMIVHAVRQNNRVRCSLDDYVSRTVTGMTGGRMSKWPTGLLPTPNNGSVGAPTPKVAPPGSSGSSSGGSGGPSGGGSGGSSQSNSTTSPILGQIDELQVTQDPARFAMLNQSVPSGAASLGVRPLGQYTSGRRNRAAAPYFIKVGQEVMAVTEAETFTVERGFLGSPVAEQGREELVWQLPWPYMTTAQSSYNGLLQNSVSIARGSGRGFLPRDGYVAIDRGNSQGFTDVIAYSQRRGQALRRPIDHMARGAFDTCFGSGSGQRVAPGNVLVHLPYRFHDRYENAITSLEGTYLQFSKSTPGAWFESMEWDITHPNAFTQMVIRLSFDGGQTWWSTVAKDANDKRRLLVFKDPPDTRRATGQPNRIHWIKRRADQIAVQVWFTYRNGAFFNDAWKQTPILKSLKFKYWQRQQIQFHEEKQQ